MPLRARGAGGPEVARGTEPGLVPSLWSGRGAAAVRQLRASLLLPSTVPPYRAPGTGSFVSDRAHHRTALLFPKTVRLSMSTVTRGAQRQHTAVAGPFPSERERAGPHTCVHAGLGTRLRF